MRAVDRLAAILLVAAVASLTPLGLAGPAAAAAPCDQQVLSDWFADGRVDRTYGLECYQVAVESLPSDLRDYTNAQAEIERALQSAAREGPSKAADRPEQTLSTSRAILLVALGGASVVLAAAATLGYLARRSDPERTSPHR